MAGSVPSAKGRKPPAASPPRSARGPAPAPSVPYDAMYERLAAHGHPEMTDAQYADAVSRAQAAAAAYYDTDQLLMTDAEYDALVDAIAEYEAAHPAQALGHGLASHVAAGASAGGDVRHPRPMLSLDKVTNDPEAAHAFIRQVTADGASAVVVEPKMDGMAVRAVYEDGRLVQIVTRGDGTAGEDVTAQYRNVNGDPIAGLPADVGDAGFTGEVRGEVYMTEADFEKSNDARMEAGKPAFANPRNATAGSLRRADPTYPVHMSFAAYDVDVPALSTGSHVDQMADLDRRGFCSAQSLMPGYDPAEPRAAALSDPAAAVARIKALQGKRDTLGFPIDGAVISADSDTRRAELGVGSRVPKWALAYKYPAEEVTSVLRDVEVTVGRTGRISLRARIDPVDVDGTTITYATLHSPSWAEAQNIGVGSRVAVKRAGDVIPRITGGLGAVDDSTVARWRPPSTCPSCGEPWDKSTLLWRCRGGCGTAPAVSYFASRDCADLDGMSDSISAALVEAGKVSDIADLYSLTAADIASTRIGTTDAGNPRLIGMTTAAKIYEQIQQSKQRPFAKILAGVGLRGTGRSLSRRLANHFGSLDAIRAATEEQLAEVEGIGPEKARLIHAELRAKASVLDRLAAAGITTTVDQPAGRATGPAVPTASNLPLSGKTYVVSGSVPGYTRTSINDRIEALGGKASGSVSRNVDFVVTAESTTSKAVKARELGIPVLDPAEFAAMLAQHG